MTAPTVDPADPNRSNSASRATDGDQVKGRSGKLAVLQNRRSGQAFLKHGRKDGLEHGAPKLLRELGELGGSDDGSWA